MNTFALTVFVIMFGIYFLICQLYLKRHLGIKSKNEWLFSKKRRNYAKTIDVIILISFIIIFLNLNSASNIEKLSPVMRTSPLFGLFILQNINQGIEEFLMNRTEKSYYYKWFGSFIMLATFLIMLAGERL